MPFFPPAVAGGAVVEMPSGPVPPQWWSCQFFPSTQKPQFNHEATQEHRGGKGLESAIGEYLLHPQGET